MSRHALTLAALLAGPALAQGTADGGATVTITGSRVLANTLGGPTPLVSIDAADLLATRPGASLADALNLLPAFANSRGSGNNPSTTGSQTAGNGSSNQLNLRGLGTLRTLVLFDGQRVPPTLFNGAVDVDLIPQVLIERVEVVTGGGSAVYGSDAITGVVNYIVDRRFEGLRLEASHGVSEQGDAPKSQAGLAWGGEVARGLRLVGGVEMRREGGVDRRTDREWSRQWGVTGAGTEANPFVLQGDLRQRGFPFGGLVNSGALNGRVFEDDGSTRPFVPGTATGTAAIQLGGDGGYWDAGLLSRLQATQLFGRVDWQPTTTLRGHVQLSGNLKTNTSFAETPQLNNVTLRRTNPFLPEATRALIPESESTFRLSKFIGNAPRVRADAKSQQWFGTAGLDGAFAGAPGWKWELDTTWGRSRLDTTMSQVLNRQRLAAALDATRVDGRTVCAITLTNPGLEDDCVPLNPFGPNAASAEALDYVTGEVLYRAVTTLHDVSAVLRGSPLALPAGPLQLAVSASWHRLSFRATSNERPEDLVDCTGLPLNCTAGALRSEFVFAEQPEGVRQEVREFAVEADVPLLKGRPFAERLNLNLAVRDTHYDTSGQSLTWRLGLDWRPTPTLQIRGTRSRDIRAPTLYDLFAPVGISFVRPTDLLTNTSPTVPSIDAPNAGLRPEVGQTTTLGLAWQAGRQIELSVDAYRLHLSDAITLVSGSNATFQRACYASGGSSPYCSLQQRPNGYTDTSPANAVTAWLVRNENIASITTWGMDFGATWRGRLFERPGSLRVLVAWQPHIVYRQPDTPTIDQGGVAFGALGQAAATPRWRVATLLRVRASPAFTVDVAQRWRSAMKLGGDPTQVWADNRMASFGTTALTLTHDRALALGEAQGRLQLFFNVENLFDATPPPGAFSGNGTRAGLRDGTMPGDDLRGRAFAVGLRLRY